MKTIEINEKNYERILELLWEARYPKAVFSNDVEKMRNESSKMAKTCLAEAYDMLLAHNK